jgi:antitoxin component YwqK of YwqJK toxin-antitoxin module
MIKHLRLWRVWVVLVLGFTSCTNHSEVISKYTNGRIEKERIETDTPDVYIEREFYNDGNLATLSRIEKGKKNGKEVAYYSDGSLLGIINYKDDKIDGPVLEFHRNGKIMFKGTQHLGELVDTAIYYNEDGSIKRVVIKPHAPE